MIKFIVSAIMRLFDIHNRRHSDDCPLNSLQATYIIESLEGNTTRIQKLEKLAYVTISIIVIFGVTSLSTNTIIGKVIPTTTEMFTKLKHYNDVYCNANSSILRDMVVTVIREKFPTYPEGGLCNEEHKFADVLSNIHPKL